MILKTKTKKKKNKQKKITYLVLISYFIPYI